MHLILVQRGPTNPGKADNRLLSVILKHLALFIFFCIFD